MILRQTTDESGFVHIKWQAQSNNIYFWKFKQEPTLEKLQELETYYEELSDLERTSSLDLNFTQEEKETILNFVYLVKANPTVNLTQFNNYLNNQPWNTAHLIKSCIYKIGAKLAERKDVNLTDFTELQIFRKVRDFIVSTPERKLKKIFLNIID